MEIALQRRVKMTFEKRLSIVLAEELEALKKSIERVLVVLRTFIKNDRS